MGCIYFKTSCIYMCVCQCVYECVYVCVFSQRILFGETRLVSFSYLFNSPTGSSYVVDTLLIFIVLWLIRFYFNILWSYYFDSFFSFIFPDESFSFFSFVCVCVCVCVFPVCEYFWLITTLNSVLTYWFCKKKKKKKKEKKQTITKIKDKLVKN